MPISVSASPLPTAQAVRNSTHRYTWRQYFNLHPSPDEVALSIRSIMSYTLSRTEQISLLSLSLACIGILTNTLQGDGEPLIASLAFSGIGFSFTYYLVRRLGGVFIKAGLKGRDMAKTRTTEMSVSFRFGLMFSCCGSQSSCCILRLAQFPLADELTDRLIIHRWYLVPKPWAPSALSSISLSSLCSFLFRSTRIS